MFLCSDFGVCERSECARKSASPLKNACIFEKRVELLRHADAPPAAFCGRGRMFVQGSRGSGSASSEEKYS